MKIMLSKATIALVILAALTGSSLGRRRRVGNQNEVPDFICPEEFGYYQHPHNCALYYVCVFGGALLESCTGGLMYSTELQTCDWPRNVVCNITRAPTISTVKITDPRTASEPRFKPSVTELFSNSRSGGGNRNEGRPTTPYTSENLQLFSQSQSQKPQQSQPVSRPRDQSFDALDQYLLEDFALSEDKSVPRQGRLYRGSQSQPKESQQPRRPVNQQVAASTVSNPSRITPTRNQQYASRPSQDNQYKSQYQQQGAQQQQQRPPQQQYSFQQTTTTTTSTTPAQEYADAYDYNSNYYYNASDFYYYDDEFGYSPFEYYEEETPGGTVTSGGATKYASTTTTTTTTTTSTPRPVISYTPSQQNYQNPPQDVYQYNQQSYIYPQDSLDQQQNIADTPPRQNLQNQVDSRLQSPSRTRDQQRISSPSNSVDPIPIYTRPTTAKTRAPDIQQSSYNTRVSDAFQAVLRAVGGGNDIRPQEQTRRPAQVAPSRGRTGPRTRAQLAAQKNRVLSTNVVNGNDVQPTRTRTRGSIAAGRRKNQKTRGGSRPTLKPSSTIVRTRPPIDVSLSVPSRPAPRYPQPAANQPASRCSKDVCLLPDCNCGKGDIPGNLAATETPQIVLLTFDDAVNDLNKELYHDLFETGRKNPNGCPIQSTMYVSHEWTDYGQVQNLYADGHEIASHSITHSFGEQFSQKKWKYEIDGMRDILAAYAGVHREDVRGMRAPFLAVGGNRMFNMLYEQNYTYDSSMPVYENNPPSWPYTLDYKIFHDCMIPPCPTNSFPGVWEVPMVMWQDLNGGRCSMGDGCSAPPTAEGIYQMLIKNFERHYTTNRAPFGLFYHAAWFTKEHHKAGFEAFLDTIVEMPDVWLVTNWQAIQWVRDPTPLSRINSFAPFGCNYPERPRKCNRSKVCNLWHKSGVRYMRTCQKCPEVYPWLGKTGVFKSRN